MQALPPLLAGPRIYAITGFCHKLSVAAHMALPQYPKPFAPGLFMRSHSFSGTKS